ncbi:hypothetical protein ACQQ2Q_22395 [Agrobacterium sp. ES01]|uniref:hypothetical protein n=1 Tax=Agrobacterium sp. ES01 TaxID=3420714 RepID=UPI003D0966AE
MPVSSKLLPNIAFMIGAVLALAFAADWLAGWLGYRSMLFCWLLEPMMAISYALGVFLMVTGLIVWAFTFFRNEKPALVALGGLMLTFLPQILPLYLGVTC